MEKTYSAVCQLYLNKTKRKRSDERQYSCLLCSVDEMSLAFTIKSDVGVSLRELLLH